MCEPIENYTPESHPQCFPAPPGEPLQPEPETQVEQPTPEPTTEPTPEPTPDMPEVTPDAGSPTPPLDPPAEQPTTNEPETIISAPEPVCHEDEDCWDCETMGNLICGPVETYLGEPMTVVSAPEPITELAYTGAGHDALAGGATGLILLGAIMIGSSRKARKRNT